MHSVDETLEQQVVELLKRHKIMVTTAESCTGGLVSAMLINVSGASSVFGEGYVTYSNEAKHKLLGVSEETLKNEGPVSEVCAREMAEGAAKAAGTRAALSVTGLAGPDGGTPEKPVGLVYIGCTVDGETKVSCCHFEGNRQKIRELAANKALDMLKSTLIEKESE